MVSASSDPQVPPEVVTVFATAISGSPAPKRSPTFRNGIVWAPLVADWFGTRHLGVNYGWILSAWGMAGLAGPLFVAAVKDATGSYAAALPIMAGLLALALVLPAVARPPRAP